MGQQGLLAKSPHLVRNCCGAAGEEARGAALTLKQLALSVRQDATETEQTRQTIILNLRNETDIFFFFLEKNGYHQKTLDSSFRLNWTRVQQKSGI